MAAAAPSGVLATTEVWAPRIFRTTQMVGDLTQRKFGIKEVENMGCTLMGATLLSMIASFPRVLESPGPAGIRMGCYLYRHVDERNAVDKVKRFNFAIIFR